MENIYLPFFSTKNESHGLGLSIVYGFVKQSGGFMRIISEEGFGTTVQMFFRRDHVAKMEQRSSHNSKIPDFGKNEEILIVEENEEVREVMLTQLAALGYRPYMVLFCGTGLSSIGQTGSPVARSKTYVKPCLLTWARALIGRPSTVMSSRIGAAGKS